MCKAFFDGLLASNTGEMGVLGDISNHFGVVETNSRGMLHMHAMPRIVHYYPLHKPGNNADTYEDYCRVAAMRHHPFSEFSGLLGIDGEQYESFTQVYSHCR